MSSQSKAICLQFDLRTAQDTPLLIVPENEWKTCVTGFKKNWGEQKLYNERGKQCRKI